MGCDIHMVLEVQREDGSWAGVHDFKDAPNHKSHDLYGRFGTNEPKDWTAYWKVRRRNYELFAALAGVRGPGPEPRGLPDDLSDMALYETRNWGDDGHSHTWYPLRECGVLFLTHLTPHKVLTDQRHQSLAELFGVFYSPIFEDCKDGSWLDKYRLIIWFDN